METIRQRLTKHARIGWGSALACMLALIFANAYLGLHSAVINYIFMGGFGAAIIYINLTLKCPRCGHNMSAIGTGFHFGAKTDQMNVCPHCAVRLDEPV
jgi:hypothetical protein